MAEALGRKLGRVDFGPGQGWLPNYLTPIDEIEAIRGVAYLAEPAKALAETGLGSKVIKVFNPVHHFKFHLIESSVGERFVCFEGTHRATDWLWNLASALWEGATDRVADRMRQQLLPYLNDVDGFLPHSLGTGLASKIDSSIPIFAHTGHDLAPGVNRVNYSLKGDALNLLGGKNGNINIGWDSDNGLSGGVELAPNANRQGPLIIGEAPMSDKFLDRCAQTAGKPIRSHFARTARKYWDQFRGKRLGDPEVIRTINEYLGEDRLTFVPPEEAEPSASTLSTGDNADNVVAGESESVESKVGGGQESQGPSVLASLGITAVTYSLGAFVSGLIGNTISYFFTDKKKRSAVEIPKRAALAAAETGVAATVGHAAGELLAAGGVIAAESAASGASVAVAAVGPLKTACEGYEGSRESQFVARRLGAKDLNRRQRTLPDSASRKDHSSEFDRELERRMCHQGPTCAII